MVEPVTNRRGTGSRPGGGVAWSRAGVQERGVNRQGEAHAMWHPVVVMQW